MSVHDIDTVKLAAEAVIDIESVPELDALVADADSAIKGVFSDTDAEWTIRGLTRRIQQAQAEQASVREQRDKILAVYNARIDAIDRDVDRARQSIHTLVSRLERKVSWPDLGTWYLTKRKARPKLTDKVALEAWCEANGYVKNVADTRAALDAVEADGLADVPGVEWEQESKSLAFRKADS